MGCVKEVGMEGSIEKMGLVEDKWEKGRVGGWGVGWEVWVKGMEVRELS